MNKEFKRMQQLAGLLTEVRIIDAHADIPRDLKEVLEKLEAKSYFMFESGSPEDDEPISEDVNINDIYEDGEISDDEYNIIKKYTGKQFVSNIFLSEYDIPNPNKPKSGFNTLIKIYTNNEDYNVVAEIPNVDVNGTQLGWFTRNGEYIFSDTGADLNEVRIVANKISAIPVDLKIALKQIDEEWNWAFESGGSPEDNEPISDSIFIGSNEEDIEDYNGMVSPQDVIDILGKYAERQFVTNEFWTFDNVYHPAPQMPRNTYITHIDIAAESDNTIEVMVTVPNVDIIQGAATNTGWFNSNGEYVSIYNNENINEVRIVGHQQLFRRIDYRSYEFNAPNGQVLEGYPTDDSNGYFVEIIGNNPLLFGTVIFSEEEEYPENEEAMKQMEAYLDKHRVLYTSNQVNMEGDDEYYLCVDLDELEIKKLIK